MTDIAFYHLERSPLDQVLPKLLEKTLQAGKRAFVLTKTEARVEALNELLWVYDQESWMPHGSGEEENGDDNPIWISEEEGNLNDAQFLFLTDGVECASIGDYERCFELFDGNDSAMLQAARGRWKIYKDAGHELTYWQQTEDGKWTKKA